MSESSSLPITPCHVLSSVTTHALKFPNRTIDSADVTFCKPKPISSKQGFYCASGFGAFTCKMHSGCSCRLTLRRLILPPSGIQAVIQSAKRGLTKMLLLLEKTWLHLHLSRKFPAFIQLNSIKATTLGRGNSNNIKMILLCFPNQFLFFSVE